jgi:bifunctional non-homologous end joining protein LigD
MIALEGDEPFDDSQFLFEPKWDGWRIQLHKQGERIEAYTRSGICVTGNFPELKQAVSAIKAHSAVLDCEGVCLRGGRPVFDDFTYRCRLGSSIKIANAQLTHLASFIVFDVLYTKQSHMQEPLTARKELLAGIVEPSSVIMPTMFVEDQGRKLFELTAERDWEGVVAKRKHSIYAPGNVSKDWLKFKHIRKIDVIVLGYRVRPFELVIGLNFRTVKNKPVGVVGSGITPSVEAEFLAEAAPLHTEHDGKTQWIKPHICCTIQYKDRTDTHHLRGTGFVQWIPDKRPEDCVWVG